MNSETKNDFEFFQFRTLFGVTRAMQIAIITILYSMMTLGYYFSVQTKGKMDGYAPGVALLFVPIYEELIFRGVILRFFEKHYGAIRGIIFVSVLFGLWHLKNIFWLPPDALRDQLLYTALIFSPITCWVTLKTRSVWFAVMLHYLNNFPLQPWIDHFR